MRTGCLKLIIAGGLGLAGCSPADEWRELRPEGSGILAMFPCKPDRHGREVRLAGQLRRMEMLVCASNGVTFALTFADIGDPAAVTPAVEEMRAAALGNVAAAEVREQALTVPGMTPNPRAARLRFSGRRPDGAGVQEQAVFFVRGLRVYQATVLAPTVNEPVAETFFGGLRLVA